MFKTMATAHDLILNTVFFIIWLWHYSRGNKCTFIEFGAIALINKLLPLMKLPKFVPGASVTGAITAIISDNPAIIPFAKDKRFIFIFKIPKCQRYVT